MDPFATTDSLEPEDGIAAEESAGRGGEGKESLSRFVDNKASFSYEADVRGLPAILIWALGGMAILMCLVGVGLALYSCWPQLPVAVQAVSLLLMPGLLWVGYAVAARRGWGSAEAAAAFACLSWLGILLVWQLCVSWQAPWAMGLAYLAGGGILVAIRPWKSAVAILALSSVAEILIGREEVMEKGLFSPWGLLWVGAMSLLMLWSLGGRWCSMTRRPGYAAFGWIGPVAFALYLLVYLLVVVFPFFLQPEELQGSLRWEDWQLLVGMWLLPLLLMLPLHVQFARRKSRPVWTYSFLLFYVVTMAIVPVGLDMAIHSPGVLGVPLVFAYAVCIIYYGADYKCPWLVLTGCGAIFLASLGIPLNMDINPLGGAAVMLGLGFLFLYASLRLNGHRRQLLTWFFHEQIRQKMRQHLLTSQTSRPAAATVLSIAPPAATAPLDSPQGQKVAVTEALEPREESAGEPGEGGETASGGMDHTPTVPLR